MDNPHHDIICSLIETPFSRLKENDRRDTMTNGRPMPPLNVLKRDHKDGKSFSRSFNTHWYTSHQWMCGSYYKQSLFCWPCLLLSKGRNNVWVLQGFSDFKNLSASVKKHELSKEHMSSFVALKRLQANTSTIRDALEMQSSVSLKLYNEDVRKNRKLLSYLIDVTCHLAKQELSFRGHDEKSDSLNVGNFRSTFNLIIKRDIEIQEHLRKIGNIFSGLSKTIQNDLIVCISEYLMETIHQEIRDSLFFAVQADDTTDILEKSQCAISVRYVNKCSEIKERFLGFYDVSEDRTADAMYNLITSVLIPFDFKNKLVGQCYDGASVMAGSLNGLQKKIKDDAPVALFVHCSAHRLNLVLQNGSKNIKNCRSFFATATSIAGFFHHSAKRTFILDSVVHKRIPSSCETRWTSRSKIIHVLDSKWEGLKIVFQKIIDDKSSAAESINGAIGYLSFMNDLEFAFLTTVYKAIFDITDLLYDILQKRSLDVSYCKNQIFLARDRIKSLRNESTFDRFFEQAELKITSTDLEPPQPPKRRKLHEREPVYGNEKIFLRVLFYEVIDNIIQQIEVRFEDMSQVMFFSLADSSKFKEYSQQFPFDLITSLTCFYKNTFDKQKLINELQVIYHDEQFGKLNVQAILKHFKDNDFQEIFPEAYKLFVLIATIPATSASVERHFSCLKRIKTYSRNSMKNDRLSSLALISIEKELFHFLEASDDFMENIITKFSLIKDRRINLIYKK